MQPSANLFWDYVDKSAGADACWPWLRSHFSEGYGCVVWGDKSRGAHVVALELASGQSAAGRCALHSCDNRSCCNPAHLAWGDKLTNAQDAKAKDRHTRGTRHSLAKLTDAAVAEIRKRYVPRSPDANLQVLAQEFNVSQSLIHRVVRKAGWQHVP